MGYKLTPMNKFFWKKKCFKISVFCTFTLDRPSVLDKNYPAADGRLSYVLCSHSSGAENLICEEVQGKNHMGA